MTRAAARAQLDRLWRRGRDFLGTEVAILGGAASQIDHDPGTDGLAERNLLGCPFAFGEVKRRVQVGTDMLRTDFDQKFFDRLLDDAIFFNSDDLRTTHFELKSLTPERFNQHAEVKFPATRHDKADAVFDDT